MRADIKNEIHAVIDFETKSACDLRKSNAWVYSKHPTTDIMCMAYFVPGMDKIRLWHPAYPHLGIEESEPPRELFHWIKQRKPIEGHNSFFERCIWKHVAVQKYNWPKIKHRQWRCSAAKAAAHSLPRALDDALKALQLGIEKDMEGNRLMMKLSKPRKPRKRDIAEWNAFNEGPMPIFWHESVEDFKRLWKYCRQDVRAEMALSKDLADLSPFELRVWQMDQEMNERGFYCDIEMAKSALTLAENAVEQINQRLDRLTDGGIIKASRRKDVKKYLDEVLGLHLDDMKAETVERALEDISRSLEDPFMSDKERKRDNKAHRILTLVTSANRTSTKKYVAMTMHADDEDSRIRGGILYCGADRTGRFSGRGVQPHNFPRGAVKDMDGACEDILTGTVGWLDFMHGDAMKHLSHSLRGALGAPPDKEIAVADFAAIEARVVFWLAGAEKALRAFRDGEDIYCDLASVIYNRPITESMKDERQLGKQGILGLGFGMGPPKFLITLLKYKISFTKEQIKTIVPDYEEREVWMKDKGRQAYGRHMKNTEISIGTHLPQLVLAKYVVDVYRARYTEVPQLWAQQETAAILATQQQGRRVPAGRVSWFHDGQFLRCRLPSGRELHYFGARTKRVKTPWGEYKDALEYQGINPDTKQWGWVNTFGGKIVENITQAVARDLMVAGMVNVHYGDNEYDLVLSIHDELMAEKPKGYGSAEDFASLMAAPVKWAKGCPVEAKAWVGKRYRKD